MFLQLHRCAQRYLDTSLRQLNHFNCFQLDLIIPYCERYCDYLRKVDRRSCWPKVLPNVEQKPVEITVAKAFFANLFARQLVSLHVTTYQGRHVESFLSRLRGLTSTTCLQTIESLKALIDNSNQLSAVIKTWIAATSSYPLVLERSLVRLQKCYMGNLLDFLIDL